MRGIKNFMAMRRLTTQLSLLRPGDSFFSLHKHFAKAKQELFRAISLGAKNIYSYHDFTHRQHKKIECSPEQKYNLLKSFYGEILFKKLRNFRFIGVTGTNGKTSVALLLQQTLSKSGLKFGSLGTLGLKDPNSLSIASFNLTTPDIIDFYWSAFYLQDHNYQGLITEVSSHALCQRRVLGISFEAVIATSVSCDEHRDYHKTSHHYLSSKAKLFNDYKSTHKILHSGNLLVPFIKNHQGIRFAFEKPPRQIKSLVEVFHKSHFELIEQYLQVSGLWPSCSFKNIITYSSIPGRFNLISCAGERIGVVDYAHTPMALDYILRIAKNFYQDRQLWVIFGCGGQRDRWKRPQMLEKANFYADHVIVTEDNNRQENFSSIIDDIFSLTQKPSSKSRTHVIQNRDDAIAYAFRQSKKRSVIIVAGKGPELYHQKRFNLSNNSDLKQVKSYEAF